ncbi:MAG: DNRLRE domain-containing protein [Clostridiales bacterium]|nr:DNRLRE domain-containing protein [Clostridiales bacterium]
MKQVRCVCSFLLSIAIICFFCNTSSVRASEKELLQLRTNNSQTYLQSDGKYRTDIYGADKYYEDSGNLVEIDNTIVPSDDKDCLYMNKANSYTSYFNTYSTDNPMIILQYKDYDLDITPAFLDYSQNDISPVLSKDLSKTQDQETCEFERILSNDNRSVWYEGILPNVDYVYTALHDGVKEDIILRSNDAPLEYSFLLNTTDNLCFQEEEGSLYLVDRLSHAQVFEMLNPYMEDAEGKSSTNLKWRIDTSNKKTILTIDIDADFLKSNTTVFPVRVDPTFITKGTNYTSDTYVSSNNSSTNYVTNEYLRTGKDTPYGVRRSYIRFKLPSGYKANGISAASLQLTLYSKGSLAINPRVHVSLGYWKSNQIVYNHSTNTNNRNNDGFGTSSISPTVSGNTYTFNVLYTIQNNYNQDYSNYGFVITDATESNTNIWATFYSSDSSNTQYIPKLSITYSTVTPADNVFAGHWSGSAPYTFDGYTNNTNSYVYNAFSNWSGIDSNVIMGTLYSGTSSQYRKIRIQNSTSSDMIDLYALTLFYNSSGYEVDENSTWTYAVIYINNRSDSIFSPLHSDTKEEIVTHELGHALGLAHHAKINEYFAADPTVCIMQQYEFYCYPKPTSHDKQTLQNKY